MREVSGEAAAVVQKHGLRDVAEYSEVLDNLIRRPKRKQSVEQVIEYLSNVNLIIKWMRWCSRILVSERACKPVIA